MPEPYVLSNGVLGEDVCVCCRAGFHDECFEIFTGMITGCCCNGEWEMKAYLRSAGDFSIVNSAPEPKKKNDNLGWTQKPDEPEETKKVGDSGYIDERAWGSTRNIGTLSEPTSTGRKRAKDMYPTPIGHVCEWAGLAAAGGGVEPIVGCLGSPATDLHHGPDKNTLNNARVSDGTSDWEQNVHLICSRCHNAWHGANNKYYEPRNKQERIDKQATPWVPTQEYKQHDGETKADRETLYRIDAERDEREKEDDRRKRNRGDRTYTGGRTTLTDDELDGDAEPGDG